MDNGKAAGKADEGAKTARDIAPNNEAADSQPLPAGVKAESSLIVPGQLTHERTGSCSQAPRSAAASMQRATTSVAGVKKLRTREADPHPERTQTLEGRSTGADFPPRAQEFNLARPSSGSYDYLGRYQPFIDVGYVELNPEYLQPQTKPVWGLAKPLPRVVRQSMVPAVYTNSDEKDFKENKEKNIDLEAGKAPVNPKPKDKFKKERAYREHAYFCKIHGRIHIPGDRDFNHGNNGVTTPIRELSVRESVERVSCHHRSYEMEPQPGEEIGLARPFGEPHRHDKAFGSMSRPSTPIAGRSIEQPRRYDKAFSSMSRPSTPIGRRSAEQASRPRRSHEMKSQPGESIGLGGNFGKPHRHDKALGKLESDDDTASSTTGDRPEGFEYMKNINVNEDVPLVSCGLLENHNHHTRWAVTRTKYKDEFAELLAVIVQLTLGFCADLSVTASNNDTGDTCAWAWGLATMVGIYIAGGISGAHLNPAISIMLWIYRGFPIRKIPFYIIAQVLGAFIAALIAFGIYKVDIIEYGGDDLANGGTAGDFITLPKYEWISAPTAFFTEFVGTAMLSIAVMALGDDSNTPPSAGMNALIIGLVVVVLSMAFGYNTGAALNPSRDFGPRLALLALGYGKGLFKNAYWVYGPWAATISGAIVGAGIYDILIFVGGESPINYPRCRMKRAVRLWKGRMHERVKKVPKKLRIKKRRGGSARKSIEMSREKNDF